MTVDALLRKRVVLVTGKGGVGRSSCAVGLALTAARARKRVLLCEMAARSVTGDLLDCGAAEPLEPGQTQPFVATHAPRQPLPRTLPGLWVVHLDPQEALQEYLVEHLKLASLVKLATGNKVLQRLWQAMPSVPEMALLNAIYQWERAQVDGRPRFDVLICDLPATGHAVAMLGVPQTLRAIVGMGPLAQRAKQIDTLLHDETRTAVCIVTLPEELPCNESAQLAARLRDQLHLAPTHILVNGVLPDTFNADESALMRQLADTVAVDAAKRLLSLGQRNAAQRQSQLQRIAELRQRVVAEFVEIAQSSQRGAGLMQHIAEAMGAVS